MPSTAPDPDGVAFDDVAFRYSDYDVPFWARPNTSAGRWHRPGQAPTQYLSLSVDGSWTELVRWEELGTADELRMIQMPMWVVRVRESRVADYSTFDKADAAGFSCEALADEDYAVCQDEGDRLRAEGFRGVLAPSASCPGAVNLTLFGPRIAVRWDTAPNRLLASFLPAKRLAIGHPPEEILEQVRHRGATHTGLRAYRARTAR